MMQKPMPLSFLKDWRPERSLLAKLLEFASQDGCGSKNEIMARTGIPTGPSSGKVKPMMYYSEWMGLVTTNKVSNGETKLGLTELGLVVFREDRFLNEPHTLWLMHLMLCRRLGRGLPAVGIADAWFALFADSIFRLGKSFRRQDYHAFLVERHLGGNGQGYLASLAGVVIRTYLDDGCFGIIEVLRQQGSGDDAIVERCSAPSDRSYYPVYAAYLYLIWDELFAGENQIALDRLAEESRCFAVLGWGDTAIYRWLEWMVDERLIQLDRYTGAAMLLRLSSTQHVVGRLYSELI
ncbi:hypothetical protein [Thiothrix lacustris]|uniref:hypothetical protein n=1 Tax=Thiothrix lacustris TaxID=525917 RepID=UPI0027E596C0|nr:hypothetical protein [Thiothrix lacustris]WMP17249.1 hypothetical protein RCS87_17970 [Thiothrix lacustris]